MTHRLWHSLPVSLSRIQPTNKHAAVAVVAGAVVLCCATCLLACSKLPVCCQCACPGRSLHVLQPTRGTCQGSCSARCNTHCYCCCCWSNHHCHRHWAAALLAATPTATAVVAGPTTTATAAEAASAGQADPQRHQHQQHQQQQVGVREAWARQVKAHMAHRMAQLERQVRGGQDGDARAAQQAPL